SDSRAAWLRIRRMVPPQSRYAANLEARVFDSDNPHEQSLFMRELIRRWRRPDATVDGITPLGDGVWGFRGERSPISPSIRAPIWIGAGRRLPENTAIG